MKLGVLLTATIEVAVKGGNFTNDERMEMYTNTLRYYQRAFGRKYPITVVENSNADLSPWLSEFKGSLDLTVLQFRPDNLADFEGFDPSKGKGYNEYLMIKKGVEILHNKHNTPHQRVTHFLKITGRYSMLNVVSMLKEIEHRFRQNEYLKFIGDVKDTCLYDLIGKKDALAAHWGESRYFAAEIEFWRDNLADCYKEMYDYDWGTWAEFYMLKLSRQYRHDKRFAFRFRTQVAFDGFSGTVTSEEMKSGKGSQNNFAEKRKRIFRQLIRWLLPNLWI